ncbi:MAG: sensor histidine kinase, partial [Coprococcus sp.]
VQALQNNEQSYYDKASDEIWLTYVIRDDNEDDKSEIRGMILFYMSCKDLTDTYDTITQAITFVVIGIGLVLVFMSLVMARSFTKPFKDMANSINRISDGFFDEEVNLTGFSEVEQISEAFNTMLHRLQELESSRQEFVSNVSHELKTPLTSMKVLADSLNMQTDAPVELYREFMQDIGEEIDRENIIINDLLSLVKMDKTEADLNIASVAINDLLESILKRLKPIASKRNIELVLESYRPVTAECDEVKLTLALSNLVENAIKYNVAGGWVQVTLDADHKFFYVTVDDSGIGIPEEYQDKIFERFYRVDKARSRETGGTGLGLSITKNIIQMHHGAIKVASKEDEGTTFSVRIPLTYIKQ